MPQTPDTRVTNVDDLNAFLNALQNSINQLAAAGELIAKAGGVLVAAKEGVVASAQKFTGALTVPPAPESKPEPTAPETDGN